jgi:hypothetical protein
MRLKVEEVGLTPLNGCRRCGEDFTSLRTFDAHQIIEDDIHRCLDHDEMLERGWEQNAQGRWVDAVAAKKTREAFSHASGGLGAPPSASEGEEAA